MRISQDNLKEALNLDDKYIEAHYLLARICSAEGEMEESEEHCRIILNLEWKLDSFSLFISSLYYQNKFDDVVEEFQNAQEIIPEENTKDTIFYFARSLSQLDRFESAINYYNSLLEIDEDAKVCYYLGCALAHEAKYEEALTKFERVVQSEYQARAYLQSGHILLNLNRIDEAEDYYKKACETDPQNPYNFYALGRFNHIRNEENEAMTNFSQAIYLDPSHYPSHYGKALIHEMRNEISEAIEEYELIIQEEKNMEMHKRLGILYCMQSDYLTAFQHLLQAKNLGDESDSLLFYLGMAAINDGNVGEGLRAWEGLFQRNPDDHSLKLNICRAHYLLGRQYIIAEQYLDAISDWETYLTGYEDDGATKENLAKIYFRLALRKVKDNGSNSAEIKKYILRAKELDPTNSQYYYYLGIINLEMCEYNDCISIFRNLLETQPDNTGLKYHLGLALLRNGDNAGIDVLKEVRNGRYANYATQLIANTYLKNEQWHEAVGLLGPLVDLTGDGTE